MKMKSQEPDPICLSSPSSLTSSTTKWWSKETTAVVTGANKGIGFAMVKRLAELGLTVVLTCRDVERGKKAVESLSSEGLLVSFFRLDVSDPSSIKAFVSWFESTFAALDILVNNAGVTFNEVNENKVEVEVEVEQEHAETVMRTNYYGAKLLTQSLLPLFRRSPSKSRILNINSRLGSLTKVRNPRIKSILQDEGLSEEKIDWVVGLFLESVKNGTWRSQGWPLVWTEYAVSKLALNAYARVLAKQHEGEGEGGGMSVNCYCPGFTQTSMTGGRGTHTADQAAQVGVRLLLLPPQELLTGRFYVGLAPFVKSNL